MDRRMTRRAFLALAGISGAVVALAACAPPPAPTPTPAPAPKGEEPTKPAPTAEPAKKEAVQLSYFYGTRVVFKDLGLVQDEMSKIMKERINATIELSPIEWAAFGEKMNVKNAAGEKYDLCFTSSWANLYHPNVKNGVLADLTDALPQFAPKYYGGLNPGVWLAPKVKGRLYAAVNQQIFPGAIGPICRKDLAEKYGLDLSKVTKPEDMEPWQAAIVAGEPGNGVVAPIRPGAVIWWTALFGCDEPGYGLVDYSDQGLKVWNSWDHPQWQRAMALTKKWFTAGYFPKEQPPEGEQEAWVKAGKGAWLFHRAKPGGDLEEKAINGWDWVSKIIENPTVLSTPNIISTMYGVNKKTSSVEACVRYLEMVNTDKPFYNLLCKGIEGKHWVWVDKAKEVIAFPEGMDVDNHPYNPNSDWEFGDQFLAYYVDAAQVGAWEETRKVNNASVPSVLLGFVLDQEPIKNELAALDAANAEFRDLAMGLLDYDKVLPDLISKNKAAGAEKVQAEVQKQLLDWKATK